VSTNDKMSEVIFTSIIVASFSFTTTPRKPIAAAAVKFIEKVKVGGLAGQG
jgi:hypothetical protein